MVIFGVTVLSLCLVVGMLVGEALGAALGVQANVGGVGIAMLLLVLLSNTPRGQSLLKGNASMGVTFWSAMYIPIVVAMAARQNVVAAFDGGLLAVLAGLAAVVVSFALVPVLSKIGRAADDPETSDKQTEAEV